MKFKFKIQQYQTEAVENTVAVFTGQPSHAIEGYRLDRGRQAQRQLEFDDETGYRNHCVELDGKALLKNINTIQNLYDITPSSSLSKGIGAVNLDIEMETGTGKTYVYIKTMFELNKQYGWSKFIVVVPSIAIREGVAKSFRMLEEHFMEHYGKKARWFIYNSGNLQQLDSFSSDFGLSVMIINTQAFASSMKEGGRSKESRIIYSERDEFGSRRPIDVIAANRPIIIMDEPQRMEGGATQAGIKRFNPLFVLNYSATHTTRHNTIYALDALDAYRQKLVKRIHVKGFEVKNLRGTSGYLYLDNIVLSPKRPPEARIELEVKNASGSIDRKIKNVRQGDNLREESGLAEYDNFVVSEIDMNGYVTFLNGVTIRRGEVIGDPDELNMQRVQIRETIMSHLEKERQLFKRGIKCLSLFFIDEVAKYKSYDENGEEVKGVFQKMFEEEYARLVNEEFYIWDEDYNEYLRRFLPQDVHRGYFSIDKKTNRVIDGKVEKKTGLSDDISAYDLILKNKERLLSFEEPTRFIFSHSALREGWDNPNVFQICTLRHSNSSTAKRQEVGRGLRICVDRNGVRMDKELLGEDVHEVNTLTVIANESYADFTTALQKETREVLRERAAKATVAYFQDRQIKIGEEIHTITETEASRIIIYLEDNGYIDEDKHITPDYREAVSNGTVAPLPPRLQPIAEGVVRLINSIFDPKALDDMVVEEKTTTPDNKLNENFQKAEFQALWNEINHQYVYTVSYDSNELIEKAILHINSELEVKRLRYVMVEGSQDEEQVTDFGDTRSQSRQLTDVCTSSVRYDLVGDIAKGANLTRRTVVKILQGIQTSKLYLFKNNPEEFIRKAVSIIKEQKATMIVEAIRYNMTEGKYDSSIFTVKSRMDVDRAYEAKKHITDYVFSDSKGERQFAHDLDEAHEVVVYAKLPRTFQIPTPVGNYAPDWAIAMTKDGVKHIFFIAETKGSMSSMDLSAIEKAKIACAEKLFNSISTANVKYHKVATYQDLIDEMNAG
ncbi:DEAD/DEAH box helicase family protein [Akkermansia muciniphila]|uniref:type III restriction-modification system endonuclease n=1 Tax=Akkermansia muciniphila TaxID=239935 RepID=UPI001600BCDE|nr:DEAD/DEAH box helicase family protein [Akkermansia muciniphila]QNB43787.1 DEAD/DEAH box helicase family protein [Akkermansia muciniphila]